MDDDDLVEVRHRLAVACRILGHAGLAEDILGHVSLRIDGEHLAVRCRGPEERGLTFTMPSDVRVVRHDGTVTDSDEHAAPNELPIHVEALRTHPGAVAAVHVHPPAVIAAELAGSSLEPIVGAYNIPAAQMARAGIPVFPRGVLINTTELAREMVGAMGAHPVCILRGHGLTTVGDSVEQAVGRALNVDSLAQMTCRVVALGATPRPLDDRDLDQLPDLGGRFNDVFLWQHHLARLEHAGLALDDPR